jgi:hypothetical protein
MPVQRKVGAFFFRISLMPYFLYETWLEIYIIIMKSYVYPNIIKYVISQ